MLGDRKLIGGVLLTFALVAFTACTDSPAGLGGCILGDVQGMVSGFSAPVFDDAGNLIGFHVEKADVTGDLVSEADADFTITSVDDDGTLRLEGSHTFWEGEGELLFRTSDEGLTTADGHVENRMTLVEGGTGTLQTEGSVDLQTGALELQFTGDICLL